MSAALRADPCGQLSLNGEPLRLAHRLDAAFVALAAHRAPQEERHGPLLPVGVLERLGYFEAFPHLATFPSSWEPAEQQAVASGPCLGADGALSRKPMAGGREALLPAACYPCYLAHGGTALDSPLYLTTSATCFRRESGTAAGRRQSAFTMREHICVGDPGEVGEFLADLRERAHALASDLGLDVEWVPAADPFFRPRQGGALMQKVMPVKFELVWRGLALASANLHQDHMGEAFGLVRGGVPATSGCVAFGLERWLTALVEAHGTNPVDWPWSRLS